MEQMKKYITCLVAFLSLTVINAQFNYKDALTKSILFFEGQRSGQLDPATLRNTWRSSSALSDGQSEGVNLVGGYYTGGDNIKFNFHLSFSMTMLSWSIIEYQNPLSSAGELINARVALKWGTDYLLKCHPSANVFWGQVGVISDDRSCWQRPEDMDNVRTAFKIDASKPGTELAGEAAAAMAAASIVFQPSDPAYSSTLLAHAKDLFNFANANKASYNNSLTEAASFYKSSGFNDELAWAAAWLYKATNDASYLTYLTMNDATLGLSTQERKEFSWDDKYAGAQILLSRILLSGSKGLSLDTVSYLNKVKLRADSYVCKHLPNTRNVTTTKQGLIFVRPGSNLQYVVNAAFLVVVYGDYMKASSKKLTCGKVTYNYNHTLAFTKLQMNYILGSNKAKMSYMVGFGAKFPQRIHHRGASIPSISAEGRKITCGGGNALFFDSLNPNPNVHIGAIVGGPDFKDNYVDDRTQPEFGEPTTFINSPAVGVFARLYALGGKIPISYPPPPPSVKPPSPSNIPSSPPPPPPPPPMLDTSAILISQTLQNSWADGTGTVMQYSVTIAYTGAGSIKNVMLSIPDLNAKVFWSIQQAGTPGVYKFPDWVSAITSAQAYSFGYQRIGGAATISVLSFDVV